MSNLVIALFAYLIDRKFGEFPWKHPVVWMGELISFFEQRLYKDEVLRGFFLVVFVLSVSLLIASFFNFLFALFPTLIELLFGSIFASMFLAHNMLRASVLAVTQAEDKRAEVAKLVSRDTEHLSESDVYKATLETYGENLSDGVVAPLLYLLLFGISGIVFYKAVNTMDSMVGYRTKHYEKFGKVAAILDDILNFIPSRLSALLIMFLAKKKPLFGFYEDGKKHDSPNAGHPITALALALGVELGGDTSYFGKLKRKAGFGKGRKTITDKDVYAALAII